MSSPGKVKQYVIAEHLGISRSTVSKVFSNREDVSEEMRDRVLNAAKEMGYLHKPPVELDPNLDTPQIGILVKLGPEAPSSYRADYLQSLSSYALDSQIALTAHFMPQQLSEKEFLQTSDIQPASLRHRQLDGLLLTGPWSEEGLVLASSMLPSVAITYGAQHSAIDTIEPDTISAMRSIVEHLSDLGHQRLAFIGFCPELYWSTERYAGFIASCPSMGIDVPSERVVEVESDLLSDPNAEAGWRNVIKRVDYLVREQGVTALVCCSDWAAYHIYAGLRECGLSVPGDVSITGFDDLELMTWGCPKISSIHIARDELARIAVARLVFRLKHPALSEKRSLYKCTFMDHGTTGEP